MSLPVTAIARVGVLTRDCRAAASEYARFFGINDWRLASAPDVPQTGATMPTGRRWATPTASDSS